MKTNQCIRGAGRALIAVGTLLLLAMAMAQSQPSISELRSQVDAHPDDVSAWVDLGNAYYDAKQFDDAKQAFLEAVAVDYTSGDAHYGLGLSEFGRGDFQAALFEFGEVTRLYPERFDGHFNRAVTLARLRRPQDSAAEFQEAIKQADPEAGTEDRINAYLGLAGQLELTEDYAGAADAYGSALDLDPGNAELVLRRGRALQRAGNGLVALPDLTALEAKSSDYRVSALIADIYVDQGQIDYAMFSLDRALQKAQKSDDTQAQASILVKLGTLQKSLGRDADAARSFQQASQADPNSWEALYNLGVSYLESGQTRSAVDPLEQAVALDGGQNGQVYLALASTYDQLSQADKALAAARKAMDGLSDPKLVNQARLIAGRSLYRQGDFTSAGQQLDEVVQASPDDAQSQLWAGLAQYQLENYRTAVRYFEKAVQLEPDSVEARINLGASYLAAERYQDAETVYQLLVQQNPNDSESFYNLGWALFSQDRRGAARDAWKSSCEEGYGPACDAITKYL